MENLDDIFSAQDQKEYARTPDSAFDKEAFAARKKQERDAVYALVDETVSKMAGNGEAFQTYLDVQSRFDRYSATNAILISAQNADATKLADFDTWKASGVYVKRGAEHITILEPGKEYTREADGSTGVFYNPKQVFDISQTTALQKEPAQPHYDKRTLLKALIGHAPCRFMIAPELPENVNVRYQREQNTIFVRPALDGDTYFRGVSQELARVRMERSGKEYVNPAFTAYCVSYMVCKRNGVSVDSFRFDRLPEAYRDMEPHALRDELGKMKELSGDMISEMRRGLEAQEKAKRSRDDGAR
jgi:hypothetical protein